jgi:uncharacterized membrane protein
MFLVPNERAKLTAPRLNALATALIAAGAFAPIAAWLYGLSALPVGALNLASVAIACVGAGFSLHISALALLGRLRE